MDAEKVAAFFSEAVEAEDTKYFHPHPFTQGEALRVCADAGKDVYAAVFRVGELVAYGLLRGWNDGWETPSLGIIVKREARGAGIARVFMNFLHTEARLRGATRVRLRVAPANTRALALYRSMGYQFVSEERGELVGIVCL
jgi:ribosomal protein S18 acetylase RimI-like enzyme